MVFFHTHVYMYMVMERPFANSRPLGPFAQFGDNKCRVYVDGDSIVEIDVIQYDNVDYNGYQVNLSNTEFENCNFYFDNSSAYVEEEMLVIHLKSNTGDDAGSIAIMPAVNDGSVSNIFISHLEVPDRFRGTNASQILYVLFIAQAILYDADRISGSVGGGERTAAFFKKMGIPDVELEETDIGKSARFDVRLDKIQYNFEPELIINGDKY